jgi:hypothetical protein
MLKKSYYKTLTVTSGVIRLKAVDNNILWSHGLIIQLEPDARGEPSLS